MSRPPTRATAQYDKTRSGRAYRRRDTGVEKPRRSAPKTPKLRGKTVEIKRRLLEPLPDELPEFDFDTVSSPGSSEYDFPFTPLGPHEMAAPEPAPLPVDTLTLLQGAIAKRRESQKERFRRGDNTDYSALHQRLLDIVKDLKFLEGNIKWQNGVLQDFTVGEEKEAWVWCEQNRVWFDHAPSASLFDDVLLFDPSQCSAFASAFYISELELAHAMMDMGYDKASEQWGWIPKF
jgi:hypothetical protein